MGHQSSVMLFNGKRSQLIKDLQALRPQATVDPARVVFLRHQLLAEIHQHQARRTMGVSSLTEKVSLLQRSLLAIRLQLAPVAVSSLIGAFVLVLAGGTVAAAAQYASPGGLLYPVKLATEQARLALAFGPTSEAKMHLRFAAERVREIGQLVGQPGGNGQSAIYRVAEQAKLSLAAAQSSLRVAGHQPLAGQSGKDSQAQVAELVQEQAEQAKRQIEEQRDRSQSPQVRAVLGEVEQAAEQTANQALEVLIRQVLAGDVDQAKLSRSALQAKLEAKLAEVRHQAAALKTDSAVDPVAVGQAEQSLAQASAALSQGKLYQALVSISQAQDSLAKAEQDEGLDVPVESEQSHSGNTNSQEGKVKGAVDVQAVPLIEDDVK